MASVTREPIGELHDKITVKLSQQDYLPTFEKEIKSFSKKANIPGFRKGMVPAGMIKKMYGPDFFSDAVLKSVNNELEGFLKKENQEIFGQPIPSDSKLPEMDMKNPGDYEFPFEIGLKPEIKISIPKDTKAVYYHIKPTEEDLKKEIENVQINNGELKEIESVRDEKDIIKVLFTELNEEGNELENGISKEETLAVSAFTDSFQKHFFGKKANDVLTAKLNEAIDPVKFPGIYEGIGVDKENEGKSFSIKILSVNEMEMHPLNEELFKKVFPAKEITSEEDFKKAVSEEVEKQYQGVTNNQFEHELYHILMKVPVKFPESFLKKWIETSGEQQKSKEEVEEEFPKFIDQLKWSVISNEIAKEQELKVSADEIKEEIKSELKKYFGNVDTSSADFGWMDEYVNRMMSDSKQIESRYDKLLVQKIFDWAKTKIAKEEKEVSPEEFQKTQSEHRHQH